MPSQVSDDWENALLDALTVGGISDPPATRYVGLRYNGTEVSASGSAYARQSITSATFWATATNVFTGATNARVNAADLVFPEATADWGYVNELCIYAGSGDTDPEITFYLEGDSGEALYVADGAVLTLYANQIVLYYWDGAGA